MNMSSDRCNSSRASRLLVLQTKELSSFVNWKETVKIFKFIKELVQKSSLVTKLMDQLEESVAKRFHFFLSVIKRNV